MDNCLCTLISPALTRCCKSGSDNLNELILQGKIDIKYVARVYKISEKQVLELAKFHRF